jgi:hypothetical protein
MRAVAVREEAHRVMHDELGWSDVVLGESHVGTEEAWTTSLDASSARLDRTASLVLQDLDGPPRVTLLTTFGQEDHGASISLGNGADHVSFDHREDGTTPELTVHYGDANTVRKGEPGGPATWDGALGYVADTDGWVQVLWRNADGVAVAVWRTSVPAGPFASG